MASPCNPREAARRRSRLDQLLDPGFFKALSDPTRTRLLACLLKCGRPCSVTEVADCCSVDFSVVARHLTALARAGLLEARKEGRTVWYAPKAEVLSERFRALAGEIDDWSAASRPAGSACGCPAPEETPRGKA